MNVNSVLSNHGIGRNSKKIVDDIFRKRASSIKIKYDEIQHSATYKTDWFISTTKGTFERYNKDLDLIYRVTFKNESPKDFDIKNDYILILTDTYLYKLNLETGEKTYSKNLNNTNAICIGEEQFFISKTNGTIEKWDLINFTLISIKTIDVNVINLKYCNEKIIGKVGEKNIATENTGTGFVVFDIYLNALATKTDTINNIECDNNGDIVTVYYSGYDNSNKVKKYDLKGNIIFEILLEAHGGGVTLGNVLINSKNRYVIVYSQNIDIYDEFGVLLLRLTKGLEKRCASIDKYTGTLYLLELVSSNLPNLLGRWTQSL